MIVLWRRCRGHCAAVNNVLLTVTVLASALYLLYANVFSSRLRHEEDARLPHPLASNRPDQMSVIFKGRLGNLMFQYASLIGIANANNKVPIIPYSLMLHEMFQLSTAIPADKMALYETIETGDWGRVHREFFNLGPGSFMLRNYLQSWRYFDAVSSVVRDNFRLRPYLVRRAAEQMKTLLKDIPAENRQVLVATHVRHEDITQNLIYLNKGYKVATLDYLEKAIKHVVALYGSRHTLFIVCSDDYEWTVQAMESLRSGSDTFQTGSTGLQFSYVLCPKDNDAADDYALLVTHANHTIMSVGTYSWWLAWMINGTTIYYDEWPQRDTIIAAGFSRTDYFMDNWIGMH